MRWAVKNILQIGLWTTVLKNLSLVLVKISLIMQVFEKQILKIHVYWSWKIKDKLLKIFLKIHKKSRVVLKKYFWKITIYQKKKNHKKSLRNTLRNILPIVEKMFLKLRNWPLTSNIKNFVKTMTILKSTYPKIINWFPKRLYKIYQGPSR